MALTERLQILIDAHAGGAIAEFKKVQGATKNLQGAAAGGTKAMSGLGQASAAAGSMLKAGLAAAAGGAAVALVKFATDAVGAYTSLAASIRDVQRVTGGTFEDASRLVAILDDFEVPVEVLNKGFFRLSREIGKNDEAFAAAGFSVAKNAKGNVDLSATLLNIADAYKATEDPAKRATLLTAAFGRGGAELIPILEQGRAGIEAVFAEAAKVGQIFTAEDIASSERYRLAMDDLHDATQQFSIEAGKVLVPVLTKIVELATRGAGRIKETANSLTKAGLGATIVEGLREEFEFLFGASDDAAGGISAATRAMNEAAEAAAEDKQALADLTSALFAADTASRAVEDAKRSLSDAQRGLSEATADYKALVKEGQVDEEKVADARRSLAEATRSLADANRGVAKAQKEYDEAVANAAALGGLDSAMDKVADAGENLADAQDTQVSASERAREAAKELRDAQAGDPEFQDKLAKAKRGVETATQGVADASYNLGRRSYENVVAHKAEEEALRTKADQVTRLKDELFAMLQLNPEQQGFLAPIFGALFGELGKGGLGSPVLPSAPPAGNTTSPLIGSAITQPFDPANIFPGLTPGTTTNNVTINTTGDADARLIAKEVMWNLN